MGNIERQFNGRPRPERPTVALTTLKKLVGDTQTLHSLNGKFTTSLFPWLEEIHIKAMELAMKKRSGPWMQDSSEYMPMRVLYIAVAREHSAHGFGACNVKGSSGTSGKLCYKFYASSNLELKIGDYVMARRDQTK